MRQELIEVADRMARDAREHILEPGEGVHLDQFTRGDEAPEYSGGLASAVAPKERPVGSLMYTCT